MPGRTQPLLVLSSEGISVQRSDNRWQTGVIDPGPMGSESEKVNKGFWIVLSAIDESMTRRKEEWRWPKMVLDNRLAALHVLADVAGVFGRPL
ncbi:hypothetical protein CLCR_06475 [Cladophialophora carrionii]|uniref:Uncharacterized protein n=1 Tax=Cladophialophora carrionii TaxID=86049 RepID=A0A1C1C7D7_9EURO|nr:hypothetical protein CLCR_06475 [Cladophialophora carrionii]